ncbi:glycosyltransferase [Patescibacteria group bacterium]|nr:glycosyltransferase [Patescibacteria group bacterium]
MILSIIIPALNEEKYLSRLLDSIKNQDFKDYEIIVADAGSTDRTKEIAKNYGAKVVKGGMPAAGRNAGAKAARGKILLILDADVILPKGSLKKAIIEFQDRKLDIASIPLDPITNKKLVKLLFNCFYNIPITILERIVPYGAMGILAKNSIYKAIKGYDEKLMLCEDHDFVRRAAKKGKFRVLTSINISVSVRRFNQDGWLKLIATYAIAELYNDFIGPIKSDIFKYKFGHYSKKIKE